MLITTASREVRAICGMLKSINESIQGYDQELKEAVTKHADYEIMSSFPGSATKTQARMIAALGDDRSRSTSRSLDLG